MAVHARAANPRRWARWAGLLLIAGGLGLLGYVAWQYLGTNWLSDRRHQQIVDAVERQWETGERVTFDELAEEANVGVQVDEGVVSALVRIPRFGDDYVVPILEGTSDEVLAAGFGHFEDTAGPGKVGNYALAAHRVTHGEPLRDMPDLQVGDEIVIDTPRATYTYELTTGGDDLVVPFTETWVIDPLPTNPDAGEPQPAQVRGQRLITLTTCSEIFHTDNRMIAFGILVEKEPRRGVQAAGE